MLYLKTDTIVKLKGYDNKYSVVRARYAPEINKIVYTGGLWRDGYKSEYRNVLADVQFTDDLVEEVLDDKFSETTLVHIWVFIHKTRKYEHATKKCCPGLNLHNMGDVFAQGLSNGSIVNVFGDRVEVLTYSSRFAVAKKLACDELQKILNQKEQEMVLSRSKYVRLCEIRETQYSRSDYVK